MILLRTAALLVLGLTGLAHPLVAQAIPSALPDRPTAYLVTIGPGDAVWERFGHNLLWIHDPAAGTDQGYNYGLFSFEQENFVLRFVRGHMEYWMGGGDVGRQLAAYRTQDRSIHVQELALDTVEVRELQDFLEWNERPENRFYRYDYYRDNCSTRVRDALDRILDGRLEAWARQRLTGATYRDHTLRLTHGLFFVSAGMHFGLGPSVDRELDAWEAMFIPMEMRELLREFPGSGTGEEDGSFVRSEWTYYDAQRAPLPETTPRWLVSFAAVGLLTAGLIVVLARGSARTGGSSRGRGPKGFLVATLPWLTAVGTAGLLVAFLWGFTDHVDTRWNLNLLQANPLHLALAVLLPFAVAGRDAARRAVVVLALTVAVLSVGGALLEVLPGVGQVNGEFVGLLLPVNLALAWSVSRIGPERPRTDGRTEAGRAP